MARLMTYNDNNISNTNISSTNNNINNNTRPYLLSDHTINALTSDIHGTLRLNGIAGLTGKQKVGMPGEVKKKACSFTVPGCPVPPHSYFEITKIVQVPMQARMVGLCGDGYGG